MDLLGRQPGDGALIKGVLAAPGEGRLPPSVLIYLFFTQCLPSCSSSEGADPFFTPSQVGKGPASLSFGMGLSLASVLGCWWVTVCRFGA